MKEYDRNEPCPKCREPLRQRHLIAEHVLAVRCECGWKTERATWDAPPDTDERRPG